MVAEGRQTLRDLEVKDGESCAITGGVLPLRAADGAIYFNDRREFGGFAEVFRGGRKREDGRGGGLDGEMPPQRERALAEGEATEWHWGRGRGLNRKDAKGRCCAVCLVLSGVWVVVTDLSGSLHTRQKAGPHGVQLAEESGVGSLEISEAIHSVISSASSKARAASCVDGSKVSPG